MKHRILWAVVGCFTGMLIAFTVFNYIQLRELRHESYLSPLPFSICYDNGTCISGESSFRYYDMVRYPTKEAVVNARYYEYPWDYYVYGSEKQYIAEQSPGGYRVYRPQGYWAGEGYYPESGYYPRIARDEPLYYTDAYPENFTPAPDYPEYEESKEPEINNQ